ncbi:alpha/beta hydrolase family protein [Microbacterium azadirachtae]|nr:CocE/NonD family hydrolase [Microbacterium azadirachtae]
MLVVALVICLGSSLLASGVTSGWGAVKVDNLRVETQSGHLLAAQLLVPESASAQEPAPAIVATHGWSDNAELQESFFIEYARRGFVVIAIDMYSHGDSEVVGSQAFWDEDNGANGTYDAVKYLATLPYVDTRRIGVTGHSNGAWSCNVAVLMDNEAETPLISAVFLVNNDAIYTAAESVNSPDAGYTDLYRFGKYLDATDTDYTNVYGDRDVGVVASQHDFLFHRTVQEDGTLTSPVDFIEQPVAQSFLYFGQDPTGREPRASNTMYTESVDGEHAIRAIYNPDLVHTQGFISTSVVASGVEFFEAALNPPHPLPGDNQVWPWKVLLSTLGVIGLLLFFTSFILVMLRTRLFGVLRTNEEVLPLPATKVGKRWLWGGLIAAGVFGALSYPVAWVLGIALRPGFIAQERSWTLGLWALANGLFVLLLLWRYYRKHGKANGPDLRKSGVLLDRTKWGKTILLGLLAPTAVYAIVFVTSYLFNVDYHTWILFSFRTFNADKLATMAIIFPLMLFFYIINSIAVNVFNNISIGRRPWVNTLIVTVFNPLGPVLFFLVTYGYFYTTGLMPFDQLGWGISTMGGWLISVVAVLTVAAFLSRVIYRHTRNPYIHAIAFSAMITVMTCSNALTVQT